MATSKPRRARVGYLTVWPGLELKNDKSRLNSAIEDLRQEAKDRLADSGLELIGEPAALVVEGTAITMDDPRAREEYTWVPPSESSSKSTSAVLAQRPNVRKSDQLRRTECPK
jgi:hypothetical protein